MLSSVLLATLAAPAAPPDLQENVLLIVLDDVGVAASGPTVCTPPTCGRPSWTTWPNRGCASTRPG